MGVVGELKTLIERETASKVQANKDPAYITLIYATQVLQIRKEQVMAAAEELEQWGLIQIGRTLNDFYFRLNDNE